MISNVRRVPAATVLLTALVVTSGCGSDSDSATGNDEAIVLSDGSGEADSTGGSDVENSDEDTVVNTEASDDVDGSGVDSDVESESNPDDDPGSVNAGTDNSGNPGNGNPTEPDPVVSIDFEAVYSARFDATWSQETHPTNFPPDPHFSPLTGAVHSEQSIFWERGQIATNGIEVMAESGGTGPLLEEIQSVIDEGRALSRIEGGAIPVSPGATEVEFTVNRDYPLVTLVSMLAPSPDWFIGVDRLSMLDQDGSFIDSVTVELNLYDSGTDGGMRFTDPDQDVPRSPIGLVNSFPPDSDFLDGQPSVGRLTITKLP